MLNSIEIMTWVLVHWCMIMHCWLCYPVGCMTDWNMNELSLPFGSHTLLNRCACSNLTGSSLHLGVIKKSLQVRPVPCSMPLWLAAQWTVLIWTQDYGFTAVVCLFILFLFTHSSTALEVLAKAVRQRKAIKGTWIGKEEDVGDRAPL